jgi:Rieske Fe-S protein
MLLKKSNGTLIAISLLCTHACCECNYQANAATFFCPCHGSIFDQNGNVTQGPASVPLPLIELNVDNNGNVFPVKFKSSSPCLSG